jgi:hypothetical protein
MKRPTKVEMPRDLQKWEVKRRLGRTKFILVHGVIFWAIPACIAATLIRIYLMGQKFDFNATSVGITVVVWVLAGVLFGWRMWRRVEARYQDFLATKGA